MNSFFFNTITLGNPFPDFDIAQSLFLSTSPLTEGIPEIYPDALLSSYIHPAPVDRLLF